MGSTELILLTSSPARPQRLNAATMSSSPAFPSVQELTQRRPPPLRTGSRAVPIPQNAGVTFISAASLLQTTAGLETSIDIAQDFAITEETPKEDEPTKPVKIKVARKPQMTKAQDEGDVVAVKKPRKPRAKKVDDGVADSVESKDNAVPKEKPARKPRVKKADADGQIKLPKGKVTKPSTGKDKSREGDSVKSKKKTGEVSNHFPKAPREPANNSESLLEDGLQLQEAGKRRTNWTPPRDTQDHSILTASKTDNAVDNTRSDSANVQQGFSGFIGGWSYSNGIDMANPVHALETTGTRKRKLIELVQTNAPTIVEPEPAVKTKAVKKKPRTITDLATSAYRATGEQHECAPPAAPLLQYISYKAGEAAISEFRTLEGFKIPAKPRNKSPVKSSTKTPKVKQPDLPKLFSPQSALKQTEKQDFVFGTSSQLAREDSPTLLRDLHQAMLESNNLDSDPFNEIHGTPITDHPQACFIDGRGTVIYPGRRNLWSASAHGDPMTIETIDMTETPKPLKLTSIQDPTVRNTDQNTSYDPPSIADNEGWYNIDDSPVSSSKIVEKTSKESSSGSNDKGASSSKLEIISSKISISEGNPSQKALTATRPNFGSYTTAQLTKEIASYRFKPVKSRDTMVSLLEKCWDGKQRLALANLGANRAMSTSPVKSQATIKDGASKAVASPKRGRPRKESTVQESPKRPVGRPRKEIVAPISPKPSVGRPRKSSTTKPSPGKTRASQKVIATKANTNVFSDLAASSSTQMSPNKQVKIITDSTIDDISDSEAPLTPSPPRRRASKIGTPPMPLELVSDDSVILSPTSRQVELHKHISKAITSLPPSVDPQNPSWHEKILLYDPIVLEDLTKWLNTGALQNVGWDGEVEPKEVKAWCLRKSICCLWRENLRGGARSRY